MGGGGEGWAGPQFWKEGDGKRRLKVHLSVFLRKLLQNSPEKEGEEGRRGGGGGVGGCALLLNPRMVISSIRAKPTGSINVCFFYIAAIMAGKKATI